MNILYQEYKFDKFFIAIIQNVHAKCIDRWRAHTVSGWRKESLSPPAQKQTERHRKLPSVKTLRSRALEQICAVLIKNDSDCKQWKTLGKRLPLNYSLTELIR